jgi:ferredoxin-NADP reductase
LTTKIFFVNFSVKQMQFEMNVSKVIQRTKDVKSIRLCRPVGFNYLPGQWIFLTIGRDEQSTKPLSLSSSPTEDFIEVTKRLTGQKFSNALAALSAGDKVLVRGPYGSFTLSGEYDKVCMLSGGIGITPLRSMIRYSTDKQFATDIILLYSNRREDDISFEEDFDEMQRHNPSLKVIITITGSGSIRNWKGLTGRINRKMIEEAVPDYAERIFFTSGPRPMVDAMRAILTEMAIPETRIKQEYFSGYVGDLEDDRITKP